MSPIAPNGDPATDVFDAVCIGETMVSFVAGEDATCYLAIAAGAESNVAVGMSRLGCRTRWVSRLGDDPLGRLVEDAVLSSGVDVSVERDGLNPTGVMVKHAAGSEKVSAYYRSESAARHLSVEDLARAGRARWWHVTGITSALSPSARGLVDAVLSLHGRDGGRCSFDVNLRPALWPDAGTAADVLLYQARAADVVFIGDDEAQELFGTTDTAALADLILRRPSDELVVKRGAGAASVLTVDGEVSMPALAVEVVDVTGAGDAFAAGYLAASCFDWPAPARLRLGHLMASRVVVRLDDVPPGFTDDEMRAITPAALTSRWGSAADGATAPAGPDREAPYRPTSGKPARTLASEDSDA